MKLVYSGLIGLGAWILGGTAQAQAMYEPSPLHLRVEGADIVFEADVCLDVDAAGPTTRVGIPRMKVEMVYSRLGPSGYEDYDLVQVTDLAGKIRIPAGSTALYGDIHGPQSSDLVVLQAASISGLLLELEPVASLDFRSGPVVLNIPSFGGPFAEYAPLFIREAHLNAYVHAQRAFEVMRTKVGEPPALPLKVKFMRPQDSPYDSDTDPNTADYTTFPAGGPITERVLHLWGAASPDDAVAARSGTTVAHEVGHHFLAPFAFQHYDPPLCLAPSDQFNEGLSDYLACVTTGHTLVALGVPGVSPRLIAGNPAPRYPDVQGCTIPIPHRRGLLIAGCLLDSRLRFETHLPGGAAVFDGMARQALDRLRVLVPNSSLDAFPDERAVLQFLIDANSDEQSLRILYRTFSVDGGVPWPLATVPTGLGVHAPALNASRAQGRLEISVHQASPGVPVLVLGSLDPSEPWVLGPATLYLDPQSMRTLGTPMTSPQGAASLAIPIPVSAIGLDIALAAVVLPSTGSGAISNGVRIRL